MNSQDLTNLKQANKELFKGDVGLRVHRAISWVKRAEQEHNDPDACFVFQWIAFNAIYASEDIAASERRAFSDFFCQLINCDTDKKIYKALWDKFSGPVRVLMDNQFLFAPFWRYHNGEEDAADWAAKFAKAKSACHLALMQGDTATALMMVFDRLYVLRNQIMHGGATWDSSVNRDQLRDGNNILGFLIPYFIELMMINPDLDWGKAHYPVVQNS